LSAICLMISWSTNNTGSLSLDCPWHWTGSGLRLATQMGLHRESTYINRPEAGRMRRLWWILIVSRVYLKVVVVEPFADPVLECR
jgi:hypothetical protein